MTTKNAIDTILSGIDASRAEREELYKNFHQHPELSLQEFETATTIEKQLDAYGITHQRVSDTGIVATIANGAGPVVAVRADIDALPVREESGKPYQSTATQVHAVTGEETPVAHACGHDVHIMSLLGALQCFNDHKDSWHGTLIGVFQPAEEIAAGAKAMIASGLADSIPHPDVYLGQHVLPTLPGGTVGTHSGPVLSQAFSVKVELFGKGTHGSMPEKGVDPVLLAATIVTRLQTIVSREVASSETAVVTVGAIKSGSKANVIPDTAEILVNVRAYNAAVSYQMKEAIERIVRAECQAARSPREPQLTYYDIAPLTDNDAQTTQTVRDAFDAYFGDDSVDLAPVPASEDFSIIADKLGVPYTFWGLGGFEDMDNAPANHSPAFAPDIQPTLDRGAQAIVVAASPWLITGA